jgi:hypothetical protein
MADGRDEVSLAGRTRLRNIHADRRAMKITLEAD